MISLLDRYHAYLDPTKVQGVVVVGKLDRLFHFILSFFF